MPRHGGTSPRASVMYNSVVVWLRNDATAARMRPQPFGDLFDEEDPVLRRRAPQAHGRRLQERDYQGGEATHRC